MAKMRCPCGCSRTFGLLSWNRKEHAREYAALDVMVQGLQRILEGVDSTGNPAQRLEKQPSEIQDIRRSIERLIDHGATYRYTFRSLMHGKRIPRSLIPDIELHEWTYNAGEYLRLLQKIDPDYTQVLKASHACPPGVRMVL